jgi:signal transduction histidine kinase/DNA-binding response OmpR family regulator/CHASE3 domain sensor protein
MKLSTYTKLYIGFATAILLAIFIGGASYMTFRNQAKESDWVKHSYKVNNQIAEVHNLAVELQSRRRGYRLTNDSTFLQPYFVTRQQIIPVVKDLQELVADNISQRENAKKLADDIAVLLGFWDASSTTENTSRQDIIDITTHERQLTNVIRDDVRLMLNEETRLLSERQAANERALAEAKVISIVGTVLVQLIIIILIYFIIREFRSRQKAEQKVQENLAEVNQLNEEANSRNWLLSGVASVNDGLQGKDSMDSLAAGIVNAVVGYVGAPAGALYVYYHEQRALDMRASASLPASARATYRIGEGLVGYAATSTGAILTTNVPAEYWVLQSASGKALPGEILCLPLWLNSELKGVLEIAKFDKFTAADIDLLNAIANSIAMAINATDANEKVMALLEQVQEQKIHLQNQQEELRQTNEELTRQAEILQASEEELRVQEEELRQMNAELEEKNEAVEISRRALSNKARELEITGKYKSEFLANMSHELRTPLNSILILAKLLAENKASNLNDKQVEYSRIIHKSGTDLLNLINDILDLSKIEAGKIDLFFEDVNTQGMIDDLRETFMVVSEQKGIEFVQQKSKDVPETIYTDKLRLEQVIKNLLSNAFKFTPSEGTVTLALNTIKKSAESGEDIPFIEIAVTDTGIGISEDKQQLIFEAFQQADGSTNRKYGGTGLGLSISKELIKKLGGEIRLKSAEGKGSTFSICLPLNKDASASLKNAVPEVETSESPAGLLSDVIVQTQVLDDRDRIQKGDKIMLIIEDDPSFASVVQDFAHGRGFKTIVALAGDEGLLYARRYKPSAIILDMQLPVLDGWSLLKILKSDAKLKNIPVHVISGTDNLEQLGDAAIAYLKKPLEKEDLENAFNTISRHITNDVKKVLVVSGSHLKNDDSLAKMLGERHPDMQTFYASSDVEAKAVLQKDKFDCVVVDIGADLKKGIEDVKHIYQVTKSNNTPVIIYLDKDINNKDELALNKISDVIIRDSRDARDRLMDELELFLYKVEEGTSKYGPRARVAMVNEKSLSGKKVLIADDDMRNVFALTTLLEEFEINVITASDGKEALEQLYANPDVDMVLMDVMMPEMDGYEATQKIRTDKRFFNLPIISLTAKAMQGDREKSIQAGASDYITKPVDGSKLISLMRVWLSV